MTTPETDGVPVVRIPIDQVTLREAADLVDDGDSFWLRTMPPILNAYPGVTPANYWELTVGEHRALLDWLVDNGDE